MTVAPTRRWQRISLAGIALAPLGCGGVEQPPRNVIMPQPSGSSIGLSCRPAPAPDTHGAVATLAFDGKDVAWRGGWTKGDTSKVAPPTAPRS